MLLSCGTCTSQLIAICCRRVMLASIPCRGFASMLFAVSFKFTCSDCSCGGSALCCRGDLRRVQHISYAVFCLKKKKIYRKDEAMQLNEWVFWIAFALALMTL